MKRILSAFILVCSLLIFTGSVSASTITSTFKTTKKVVLKSSYSTKSKTLISLPKGARFTTKTSKKVNKGIWYQTTYKGKKGWIVNKNISLIPTSTKSTVLQTTKKIGMKKTASTKAKSILTIPQNAKVTSKSYIKIGSTLWKSVTYQGKTGWVQASYLKTPAKKEKPQNTAVEKYVTTEKTRMWKNYEHGWKYSEMILYIPKNIYLTSNTYVKTKNGIHQKVTYNGQTGWVELGYLKEVKTKTGYTLNEFSKISGNITWQYNQFIGTKPDVGAKVFLIPDDFVKSEEINRFWDDMELYISVGHVPENSNLFCSTVDGFGQYEIGNIPPGNYLVVIVSDDTHRNPDDPNYIKSTLTKYVGKWDDYFYSYAIGLHKYDFQEIKINPSSQNRISKDFGYTYF